MPGDSTQHRLKSMMKRGRSSTESDVHSSRQESEVTDSILPPSMRSRLDDLFCQIEREFENIYAENLALHDEVKTLQERLYAFEKGETPDPLPEKSLAKKSAGAQISQKIKTTYKASTSKIVSSFRTTSTGSHFVKEYRGHRDGVWCVSVSRAGQPIIGTASADHTARLWCIETGGPLLQYTGHQGSVNSIRFHPSQAELVITASGDKTAHIWKAHVNLSQHTEYMKSHGSGDDDLDASEKDEPQDEMDMTHDLSTLRSPLMELIGHQDVIIAADWLSGGNQVITASWDRSAIVWDAESGDELTQLIGHDLELTDICPHPTQKLVVTSSKDTTFRLWDLRNPSMEVNVFQGHTQPVTSAVFAGSEMVVSGSDDRSVKVWDLKNMRSPLVTIRTDSAVNRLGVSNTSYAIAIPHDNRHVRVYDIHGTRITRLPRNNRQGHNRMVCAATWCDENSVPNLFTCGFDRRVYSWSVNLSNKE